MTKNKLAETVDSLGKIRDLLHARKTEERALTEIVRDALKAMRRKDATIAGRKYSAELLTVVGLQIVDVGALKRVAGRKFLKLVKADLAAVRRELGDDAAKRLGNTTRTVKVRITSNVPAKAPRRAP